MTNLETSKPLLDADPKTCAFIAAYLSSLGLGHICDFKNTEDGDTSAIILESQVFAKPIRIGTFLDFLATTHIRRAQNSPRTILTFQGGILDIPSSLFRNETNGREIRLTEKEIAILVHLDRNKDQIVSRKDLLAAVWEYAENVETHTLETHIYRLRQKIETDPANPTILLTQENGYGVI